MFGRGGTGGVATKVGAPAAPLTALEGGPLGGGGLEVSVFCGVPPFLLTHFLSFSS